MQIQPFSLSPVIASTHLMDSYKDILYADSLAQVFRSIIINNCQFSGDWITTLINRVKNLRDLSYTWSDMRVDIFADYLSQFSQYAVMLRSIKDNIGDCDKSAAIELLNDLAEKASDAKRITKDKCDHFENWISSVNNRFLSLEESVRDGWTALSQSECKIVDLSNNIALLQQEIINIQSDEMSKFTSVGQSVTQTIMTISYQVLIAGQAASFLSAAGMFFTIGKGFYDIFSSSAKVEQMISEISEGKISLSQEAQALAQTKGLLQFLYSLHVKIARADNGLRSLVDVWDSEISTIRQYMQSINTGSSPQLIELSALSAQWEMLAGIAKDIINNSFDTQKHIITI